MYAKITKTMDIMKTGKNPAPNISLILQHLSGKLLYVVTQQYPTLKVSTNNTIIFNLFLVIMCL